MPTISLPPRCDRAAAEALLPEMIAALGSGPLVIDARDCAQIGQAMLQILISARRTGEGALIEASPVLRDTAQRLGLESELFDDAPGLPRATNMAPTNISPANMAPARTASAGGPDGGSTRG